MRLIRALTALTLLKVGYWMIDCGDGLRLAGPTATHGKVVHNEPLSPAGHILLASLVGLVICFMWITSTWRAWG